MASQDWPEVTKYAGLVCAQAHRQELIQDLYKTWHDPDRGAVSGGMIRCVKSSAFLFYTFYCLSFAVQFPFFFSCYCSGFSPDVMEFI